MSEKRKILFLMPSLRGGGAERTLINLLKKIDYDRYEVDLVVVSKHGIYTKQVPTEVGVSYLYKYNFLVRVLGYLHRTFQLEWFFRRKMQGLDGNYDVGISFLDSNYTDLLFYTDKIGKRIAIVQASYLSHSNYEKFYKHDRYRNKIKKNRYTKLDGIYFVSHDSMEDFKKLFGEVTDMGVVYNMIDKEAVLEKSENNIDSFKTERFTFTAVGSLLPIKGFDRLIRSSGIAKDHGYKFLVRIAGAGPEEDNLRRIISDLNLEEYFELKGFVQNPYPLMKSSDVFVMTSLSEGLPTVLCEAMILGLPCLVTDCSGCRGLVEEDYGLTAKQNDKELAEKMMLMMDEPSIREKYSRKAKERSMLFNDEMILKAYYDIFEGKMPVSN